MKNLIKILLFFALLAMSVGMQAQKIYSVNHEYQADVRVYVVDHEYQADLLVYRVDHEYQAKGNEGKWFFVDHEYQSDVRIYFVDHEYQAGWRENAKKHLLYSKKR